jgi:exosome complex component RRP43
MLFMRSSSTPRFLVLSDPIAFEEPLMDMTLTVIVDDQGELISTTDSGGQSQKRRCCSVLIERKKELCSLKTDGI